MVARVGADPREVRVPADLEGLDALIIPGGESTVMTLGIEREGLAEPLRALIAGGTPVLGTCAGMIMLDRDHLGVLDIVTRRNAFGRQVRSFEADVELDGVEGGPMHAVFIRAPWVAEHGPEVEVLAQGRGASGRDPAGQRAGGLVSPRAGRGRPACTAAAGIAGLPRRLALARAGPLAAAGVGPEIALERGPVERGTPSGQAAAAARRLARHPSGGSPGSLPRESQAASAETTIPEAYSAAARTPW